MNVSDTSNRSRLKQNMVPTTIDSLFANCVGSHAALVRWTKSTLKAITVPNTKMLHISTDFKVGFPHGAENIPVKKSKLVLVSNINNIQPH